MPYKFLKSHQLKDLLDGAEKMQKKDIFYYSCGHLNESLLCQRKFNFNKRSWKSSKLVDLLPSYPLTNKCVNINENSCNVLNNRFELNCKSTQHLSQNIKNARHSLLNFCPLTKEAKTYVEYSDISQSHKSYKCSGSASYSDLEDSVFIEELPLSEVVQKNPTHVSGFLKKNRTTGKCDFANQCLIDNADAIIDVDAETLHKDKLYSTRISYSQSVAITCKDQYKKMKDFQNILKLNHTSERNIMLSGPFLDRHLLKLNDVSKH